jgi:DNA-directed RNA polymerase alpha subunit
MYITILCDQQDCLHNKGAFDNPDYSFRRRCINPDGVIISTRKGCHTKEINPIFTKSIKDYDLSCRAINALQANDVNTIGDLVTLMEDKPRLNKILNIGKHTRQELDELLDKILY